MADTTTSRNYRNINADLYKALLEGDDTKVCDICQDLPDGPLHKLTIHNDTVVHVASYYKRNNLVLQLLGLLPEDQFNKLTSKNDAGNTILHATAANNKTVEAAGDMLRREPSLLTMTDMHGETPFFRAARYGKSKSFRFFREKVSRRFARDEDVRGFLVRDDKATILHVAIHSENFDLAHDIAKIYPMLMGEQDGDGMTSFQLLACKPSAFNQGYDDHFFKRFICKWAVCYASDSDSDFRPRTRSAVWAFDELNFTSDSVRVFSKTSDRVCSKTSQTGWISLDTLVSLALKHKIGVGLQIPIFIATCIGPGGGLNNSSVNTTKSPFTDHKRSIESLGRRLQLGACLVPIVVIRVKLQKRIALDIQEHTVGDFQVSQEDDCERKD